MSDLAARLQSILAEHIGTTCTAAVCLVELDGSVVISEAAGRPSPGDYPTEASPETSFDLASLTKAFVATAILRLVDRGAVGLEAAVGDYILEFAGPGKDEVTVRHLLTHTSGLPPLIRLYGPQAASGDPWAAICRLPLDNPAVQAVAYSDPGFMLVGRIIERASGRSLPDALQQLVLEPVGLKSIGFGLRPESAATELDPWRGRRLHGEVHDENSAVLGGVSGHAGLFGTAADVLALTRAYRSPSGRFLSPELIRQATTEQAATGDQRRGLGWKLRSPSLEASESPFSAAAFGHYGFTGTAVWADPARGTITALLTNRVYFGRDPGRIQILRRSVFSAVAEAFPAGGILAS